MSSIEKAIEEVRLPLLARITELEEEVLRLRQQRDAANARLDWLLEQPEVSNGLAAKIQES
ncbi:hypothetical protein SHWT1_13 [Salmonella phage SHWT1]|uniref:Uncharacterized protein n=1 Tax=Salmonella phage SHWT1 TaxID=2759195 RepID=A0A7G8AKJ7_9CAUD|nr:hypothetical protein QA056_gp13 [Salmonella phage SHWT1]QNI20442.1 hypothetical protein SHWT1_13 [Salmonella phage SHWT1]